MLYKFKSKATGDLILLEPQGRQFLSLIGKTIDPKGIIEPEQMPEAISLRQRTKPIIDMLERCHKAGQPMVWGV